MDTRYIAIMCFGALALFLCFLAGFFTKTERVKTYIAIKGLANFSYILLALICSNLIFNMYAYALFIVIGLIAFMFSTTIRAIPTRSDMFHAFYTIIEAIGFISMTTSIFFLVEMPIIGMIVAAALFVVLMIVYLITRKADAKKDKIANLILILTSCAYLGIAINLVIVTMSVQAFLMAGGGLLTMAYTIIQTHTSFTNKKCGIAKNILMGLGLICIALSIFFI